MTRLLVVDDEPVVLGLMVEILDEAGYDALGVSSAESALERLDDPEVALVLSDIVMPGLTGLELLEAVHGRRPGLPVVLVTGAGTHRHLSEALACGAQGLVVKPFSHAELEQAVSDAIERSRRAERDLRERLLAPTLASALANAIEARDLTMQGHTERMAALAVRVAVEAGLAPDEVETARLGAILHDVGKIGIPDHALAKPGALSLEEQALVRTHTLIGDRLLEPLDLLASVRPIVRHHHERWDGGGYPDGLAGEQIPRVTRVVSLADSVEAMSARRPYREPLPAARIVAELEAGRGAQWDPALVEVVLGLIRRGALVFEADGLRLLEEPPTTLEVLPATRDRRVRILLVEDDPDHAALVTDAIESVFQEVRIVHADDVAHARDLWRSSSWSLALIDHMLPDGNGLELLHFLHRTAPETPVMMLTGQGTQETVIDAFRSGATDYVVKNAGGFLGELTERLRALLEAA